MEKEIRRRERGEGSGRKRERKRGRGGGREKERGKERGGGGRERERKKMKEKRGVYGISELMSLRRALVDVALGFAVNSLLPRSRPLQNGEPNIGSRFFPPTLCLSRWLPLRVRPFFVFMSSIDCLRVRSSALGNLVLESWCSVGVMVITRCMFSVLLERETGTERKSGAEAVEARPWGGRRESRWRGGGWVGGWRWEK